MNNNIVREKNAKYGLNQIAIYTSWDGKANVEVKLEKDTIWLTQAQIAQLFGTQRPAITKHINNILKTRELDEKSVSSVLEHTATDGKKYNTAFYSLDMIISVGYRVNSQKATSFRIWATKTLKDYLVNGYILNVKNIGTRKIQELQKTIKFLKAKSKQCELKGQAEELLSLLEEYSGSLTKLFQYDNGQLPSVKGEKPKYTIAYDECLSFIAGIKSNLAQKGEATSIFGNEISKKFDSIIGSIYQTFDGTELYTSVEEKAANLMYLIIKDHPFSDGNKRIASLLFLYFLEKNEVLSKENGERKINDNTILTLALLIANSDPKEKEVMVGIITSLLKE